MVGLGEKMTNTEKHKITTKFEWMEMMRGIKDFVKEAT
jgi:hypothetical protein